MQESNDPLDHPERLAAVAASDLLDAGVIPALDRVARTAARLLDAPVAQLNVVTADQQIPISYFGADAWGRTVTLERSYCQHVIRSGEPLVVENACEHPLVSASPATAEGGIVAYLSVPILSPRAASPIATLCVVDFRPRPWNEREVITLADLAAWARSEIEFRAGSLRARLQAESEREHLIAAERAAREEAEQTATVTSLIMAHVAEGICMMDAGGRLTYMNPAAERILGWTRPEIEGAVLHDVVHHTRPDGSPFPIQECPLGRVLGAAQPVLGMVDEWIRKDGTFVPLVTTCVPLMKGSEVVGAVLSMHDDTERRRAEAERERLLDAEHAARAEAEAANRAKTEFLAVMSHELRTPLNAIGGYTELLEMGIHGPVTEAQRTALHRIHASQRHLLGLINEVLNYAKLETGAVRYELEDVRVQEVLAAVAGLVEPQACACDQVLTIATTPPELRVRADAEKLRQILVNLLSNAIKFTDAGGRIDVTCERIDELVHFAVRDTGIGIPADKLVTIFEPFVQVRSDLARTADGTGLGLAISRDLARGMGGDLSVESALGDGSTFTLVLPAPAFHT